jgi:hypothetical protein
MTDEGYKSLKVKAGWRDPQKLMEMGRVLVELQKRALDNRTTCLHRVTHITNFKSFSTPMLAMLNRRGGVLDRVERVMEQHKCSVQYVWKDLIGAVEL